jgi:type IV pilus assembly protein PilY1
MKPLNLKLASTLGVICFAAGVGHAPDAMAQAAAGGIDIAQQPLFTQAGQPPLNMLVMGKDHKIYYEAYNDASDLNGDGALDIGYKPAALDYYGYFNSNVCYTWDSDKFVPASATANKQCSGSWSGDFLNYLTTSRMDALRRVLYGGWRQVDSESDTVLQGAFFPQDGHSWGKEYQSVERDGYNIANYAPLAVPPAGRYHLFAITTLTGNGNTFPNYQAPVFRVLQNTDKRVWNWLSIEGPVAGTKCFTAANTRTDCVPANQGTGIWDLVPSSQLSGLTITTWKRTSGSGSPGDRAAMNTLFNNNANNNNRCGSATVSQVNATGSDNNPFNGTNGCTHDNYLTRISGQLTVPADGTYRFGVDGDDAVDLTIDNTAVVGWYGGHGNDRTDAGLLSHSNTITLSAGTHTIEFRHQEAGGGDNWGLFQLTPTAAVSRQDYFVRVQSCPASSATLREATCKQYPNGQFKPTGILHDYGETSRMYFGLITGTQFNNLEGGVLRRNVSSFGEEINSQTGQFRTDVNGIATTISSLRMIGGGYGGDIADNTASDAGWVWNNGTGNCPSVGDRAIVNGECRMWGNPLAEMLYESMRYFAGAATPTARFNAATNAGNGEETTLGLTKPAWKDPYAAAPDGGGYLACAKPYQTIISDINPSYDGDLPGSPFDGAVTTTSSTPTSITSFNAATEGQAIWNAEFGAGARRVFIGDVNNVTDGAPTAKSASSFGNIRGLSPEEPTKGGTYFSASVARFARNTDLSSVDGDQNLSTYAIALASPLPRIEFPIGGGKITLLPFAKTASGTFGGGTRKPTNTIVDFYVESIANLPGQPEDAAINEGRAYAVFRINYEDVEQGNDHDMDAIVRYLISANEDGTVTVTLNSEYAAGSANQNMGYVISGTSQDGVYLEVRDTDSNNDSFYALNTPNPVLPGGCGVATPPAVCSLRLPLNSTRTFTATADGDRVSALLLNDPLWYAAKYGAPQPATNDADGDGVPDNYFLVTNPGTLRAQLDKAFSGIIEDSQPTASVATSTPRFVPGATLAYEASYKSIGWIGDISAYRLLSDGTYSHADNVWSASAKMPAAANRNIFTSEVLASGFAGVAFTEGDLDDATIATLRGTLDEAVYDTGDLIAYLRGDQSNEVGSAGCDAADPCPYRKRDGRMGDVLNSTPAVVGVTSFGYGSILEQFNESIADTYAAYVELKKGVYGDRSQSPILYVGSNDGMLHAIDGSEGTDGGVELFAYMPNAVLPNVHELATPGYTHRFFVDGSPTVIDAHLGSWKTVLTSSTGAGAKSVFALDITDPRNFDANDVLWEFNSASDPDMGQFVGRPYAGITGDGAWVAAFGNGYNSARQRAVLFVRDLATGDEIAKVDTGVGCPSTDPDCVEGPNGLSAAAIVDNDGDGAGDTIYAGDYQGNMWRFELGSGGWELGNGGVPLFVARDTNGKRQSITSGVYTLANPLGGTMVVFGTGRYLNAQDADEDGLGQGTRASVETLYGIWDSRAWDPVNNLWTATFPIASRAVSGSDLGYADLQEQQVLTYTENGNRTATRNPLDFRLTADGVGKMGWYMDLECTSTANCASNIAGERVTATPQGILGDVVFNTFRPQGDTCQPGSQNATLVLDVLAGAANYVPIPPVGGWPDGLTPPPGLLGVDTVMGPPPGEPPIVIIRPPNPIVPCLPGAADCPEECQPNDLRPQCQCDPADPTCDAPVKTCSWRSPNPGSVPPGAFIPCGRLSWKQLR